MSQLTTRLRRCDDTRAKLLQGLADKGFGHEELASMQKLIDADNSDLFDVLAHVAYALLRPELRSARSLPRGSRRFWTSCCRTTSPWVLVNSTVADLGQPDEIGRAFAGFQKFLYQEAAA